MLNVLLRVVCASILLSVISITAAAQTRFVKPDTTPDYSRYLHSDECLVAIERIADSLERRKTTWKDTMSYQKQNLLAPYPPEALTAGQRCVEKFSPDSVPLADAKQWATLYLKAGRDTAAVRVYERLIDSLPVEQRFEAYGQLYQVYEFATPLRYEAILGLYEPMRSLIHPDSLTQALGLYASFMRVAEKVGDTAQRNRMAHRVITWADSLSPEDRRSPMYINTAQWFVYQALNVAMEETLMDSLRRGTDAYVSQLKANWAKASDGAPFAMRREPYGEMVPPIEAEYWYAPRRGNGSDKGQSATASYTTIDPVVRPVANRANVILMIDRGCHDDTPLLPGPVRKTGYGKCWRMLSVLRRLAHDFPQVEFTLVVQTMGFVGDGRPLTPAQEADTLASYYLDFHDMPATLVVAETPFLRIDRMDRRRVDMPTSNAENFQFGVPARKGGNVFLVGRDGKLVDIEAMVPEQEEHFRLLLRNMVSDMPSRVAADQQ
jgi:hypothetical protein